jgi:hypothetical protein
MELTDFVFAVLKEISPMPPEQASKLRFEIETDIQKVVTDETSEGYQPNIKAKVLKFFRNPWVRLVLAASFLLVVKSIKDWYNGKYDQVHEDIED